MPGALNYFRRINAAGESFAQIIWYWLPEIISATILFSFPSMIDSWIISQLGATTIYGALGMGSNFLHFLIKLAEAIPVASIAIIGRHNGAKDYERCGEGLADSFWTTFILGLFQLLIILVSARLIYTWLRVPEEMIAMGAPFLRLKSIGVFFVFITLGLLGFIRAVKNTHIPMLLNVAGIASFVFFDYALVLGRFGFPQLGLNGSALATIIQYSLMSLGALLYILHNPEYKKYFSQVFFSIFSLSRIVQLLNLSWPVMLDKSAISFAYIWLSRMIAPMGTDTIVSYSLIKDIERSAMVPVVAVAQVLVILVSNRLGLKDAKGVYANIKKAFFLATIVQCIAFVAILFHSAYFIGTFDPTNTFTTFASPLLIAISLLSFLDYPQIVLAGALRGAGDVKSVMWIRFFCCIVVFLPVSYGLSLISGISVTTKFLLLYGSFYVVTGVMGLAFLYRIKYNHWRKIDL